MSSAFRDPFGVLTPLGRAAAVLGLCGLLAVVGHGLGLRWDPFDLSGRRLRGAEARAAKAEAGLDLRRREAEAREAQQHRLDVHHRQSVSVAAATAQATTLARSAHDASTLLDPARLARLREHDRQLCDASPSVCTAAAADPPAGGDHPMPSRPAG
ncbi:MAG TPA: hypothetical protein VGB60_06260 [Brevundimonas sp.]|uniref:hypothetical protein n=1 Tax=Brevundimonas sp. TaxID=1871086 RepID=UPI002ED9D1F0